MTKIKQMQKKYYFIMSLLLIYSIIIGVVIFIFAREDKESENYYLYLDSESIFKYDTEEKEWTIDFSYNEINGQIFNVYEDTITPNEYKLYFQERNIYYYSLDDEPIKMLGYNWFAISKDDNIKVKYINNHKTQPISTEVKTVLLENSLENFEPSIVYEASIDIDGDGSQEKLYSINNRSTDVQLLYSIVFVVNDNSISYLKKDIIENEVSEEYDNLHIGFSTGTIETYVSIDNRDYLFLKLSYAGRSKSDYKVYTYENGEFKLIKSFEE